MHGFFQCTLICVAVLVTLLHETKAQGPDQMPPMPHKQPKLNGFVGGGGGSAGRMLHAGFLKAVAQRGPQEHPHGGPPGRMRGGRGGGSGGKGGEGGEQQDNMQV